MADHKFKLGEEVKNNLTGKGGIIVSRLRNDKKENIYGIRLPLLVLKESEIVVVKGKKISFTLNKKRKDRVL